MDISFLEYCLGKYCQASENVVDFSSVTLAALGSELTLDFTSSRANICGYGDLLGLYALRQKISEDYNSKYGTHIGPNNVIITNGALHGVNLVLNTVRKTSNKIICHSPIYINIHKILKCAKFQITYKDTLALESIRNYDDKSVECILLNLPNNPDGSCVTEACMKRIEHAQRANKNLKVIVDMVYDAFADNGVDIPNPLNDFNLDQTYLVNSVSKSYLAPGVRIGWVISSESNIRKLSAHLESQCITVTPLSQSVALSLLNRGNKDIQKLVRISKEKTGEVLKRYENLSVNTPESGLFFKVGFSGCTRRFIEYMLVEHKTLMVGSENYAGCDEDFLRIPFRNDVQTLDSLLKIVSSGVEQKLLFCGGG